MTKVIGLRAFDLSIESKEVQLTTFQPNRGGFRAKAKGFSLSL
jgi:hypothetical protein